MPKETDITSFVLCYKMDKIDLFRRLFKNTVSLMLAKAIDSVALIAITTLIARYLGLKLFGDYGFISSFVVFFSAMVYCGIERVSTREISRNKSASGLIAGDAIQTRWALSGMVVVLIFTFVMMMDLRPEMKIAAMVAAVSQLSHASYLLYMSFFQAYERMEYEPFLTLPFQCLTFTLVVIVVTKDMGFLAIFGALAIPNVLKMFISMMITRYKLFKPEIRFSPDCIIRFLKSSLFIAVVLVINQAILRIDILLLKFLKNSSEVALFHAPNVLLTNLVTIPWVFSTAFFPTFSQLIENDKETLGRIYGQLIKVLSIINFFIVTVVYLYAEPIIRLVFGPELSAAYIPLKILIFSAIFLFIQPVNGFLLIAADFQKRLAGCAAGALLVNVVLDVLLIPRLGATGACIASVVAFFILYGLTARQVSIYIFKHRQVNFFLKLAAVSCTVILLGEKALPSMNPFLGLGATVLVFGCLNIILKIVTVNELVFLREAIRKREKKIV